MDILDVILGRMVYRQRMLKYDPQTMSISPLESLDKLNIRSFFRLHVWIMGRSYISFKKCGQLPLSGNLLRIQMYFKGPKDFKDFQCGQTPIVRLPFLDHL